MCIFFLTSSVFFRPLDYKSKKVKLTYLLALGTVHYNDPPTDQMKRVHM